MSDKKKKAKKNEGGMFGWMTGNGARFSGAGPRRDKKLREAEEKALGIKKKK